MLKRLLLALTTLFGLSGSLHAQGTIPIALSQVMSANGIPEVGCLLYIYQAGTVSTAQNAYTDTGLTIPLPNPMSCDANGRLPMFYLANGFVHVRLTDASGIVQFDYPSMLVVGPSSGSGGTGGGSVDPTSILSTGDIKFRMTGESVTGWVKINGLTVGSAFSGATGRANADTQNLFTYLWQNCTNAHCPVAGGRGSSPLADFQANKQLQLPDWRASVPVGLDDMGNTAAGILQAINVTSGGGDGTTTPGASGGQAVHTMTVNELVAHTHAATDAGHTHPLSFPTNVYIAPGAGTAGGNAALNTQAFPPATGTGFANITNASTGGGAAFNVMSPFKLGSWYMKL
jgi:hypothetical protein